MDYQHYDLSVVEKGKIVEVELGYAANVRIMDDSNYRSYRNRKNHRFIGGFVKQSPFRVSIPHYAHWHVVIDLGGSTGTVKSAVRVL